MGVYKGKNNKHDKITGKISSDKMYGYGGNDTLKGAGGNDFMYGGAGKDAIIGGTGNDRLYGNAGGDKMYGEAGNDKMYGEAGNDIMKGGAGNDLLCGAEGTNIINGETGFDTATYANWGAKYKGENGVSVNLLEQFAVQRDRNAPKNIHLYDELLNIENITGSAKADYLIGNNKTNRLDGGAGDDVLIGLGGGDRLNGGKGFDTADYSDCDRGVIVNLAKGAGERGDAAYDRLSSVEKVIGSENKDIMTGDKRANVFVTGGGADIVEGGGGADIFTFNNSAEGDKLTYKSSKQGVEVNFYQNVFRKGDAEGDKFASKSKNNTPDMLEGSQNNDILGGSNNSRTEIYGLKGDDMIYGVNFGYIDGGAGSDTLCMTEGDRSAFVYRTISLKDLEESQYISRVENLTGYGKLTGGDGNNVIRNLDGRKSTFSDGGEGNDTLYGNTECEMRGGEGSDILERTWNTTDLTQVQDLYGDAGEDIFRWTDPSKTGVVDVIKDFEVTADKIDLRLIADLSLGNLAIIQINSGDQTGAYSVTDTRNPDRFELIVHTANGGALTAQNIAA